MSVYNFKLIKSYIEETLLTSLCDTVVGHFPLDKYYQCKNFVELAKYINQRFEYGRVTRKLLKIFKERIKKRN